MKKLQMLTLVLLTLMAVMAVTAVNPAVQNAQAQGDYHPIQGFTTISGYIEAGLANIHVNSQLEVNDKNRALNALEKSGDRFSRNMPALFFNLNYHLAAGAVVHIGIPMEDDYRIVAGIEHPLPAGGSLDVFAAKNLFGEVWKNPYDAHRKATRYDQYGGGIKYSKIAGSAWVLEYRFDQLQIDDDEIGRLHPSLEREGLLHQTKLSYTFHLGHGFFLQPDYHFTFADLDGSGNRYREHNVQVSLMKMHENYVFCLGLSGGRQYYAATHPIFEEKRDDLMRGAMALFKWMEPFSIQKSYVNLGFGWEKNHSNIDFFDADTQLVFLTMGYNF